MINQIPSSSTGAWPLVPDASSQKGSAAETQTAHPTYFQPAPTEDADSPSKKSITPESLGIKKGHVGLATFMYETMYKAKEENDNFSNRIAKEHSGKVITAPMKSIDRSLTKIDNDYAGDMGKIKDITRSTVIINSDKIDDVLSDLQKKEGMNIKHINGDVDPLGYSGINATYKAKEGGNCELQVITPAMIFGKMNTSTAKSMLGEEYCRRLEEASGQKGGLGHGFYEQYRTIDPNSEKAKDIAQQSKDYYAAIRNNEFSL